MVKAIVHKVLFQSYLIYIIDARKCILRQIDITVFRYIMSVTGSDNTIYISPLTVYSRGKYMAPDVSEFQSTSGDCASAAYSMCGQYIGNEESTDAGSPFSSTSTMVGSPEGWVIPGTP